ncbi:galactokinase [Phycomyces blakesleeanus]|uniref:Galactokinase n=2 Tax=Phycomyces blakesleeanus TaxID=4837 RepID=A0ABR3B994_PHYBL
MSVTVPVYDTLESIYDISSVAKQGVRYNRLIDQFTETYGRKPEFIVRSPGRVNLIGEHIDYCGFGVLPMAIERDVVIVGATTDADSKTRLTNADPKYPPREFDYEGKEKVVTIDASELEWSNYFKCGYKGMLERANLDKPKGLSLLVDGNVPAGGGLSSSAAFVCASALAVIVANKLPSTKQELTEIAIVAERNVGVNSGGMDQSASVFSEKDYALRVEFVPRLSAQRVKLPQTKPALAFVIANTLVKADKFVTAPRHYNLRVVETKMAGLFLSKALGLPKTVDTLKEVLDLYFASSSLTEEQKLTQLLERAEELFPEEVASGGNGYTLDEVSAMVGWSKDELHEKYMSRFPVQTDFFRVRQRTHHVLTEARRVYQFSDACEDQSSDNTVKVLGELMNESQDSCKNMFDCSCPEIEQICEIARRHGAYGARLTGAGWGGSTVMLTDVTNVDKLINAIKDEYYRPTFPTMSEEELDDAILSTKPCSGSAVFDGFKQ